MKAFPSTSFRVRRRGHDVPLSHGLANGTAVRLLPGGRRPLSAGALRVAAKPARARRAAATALVILAQVACGSTVGGAGAQGTPLTPDDGLAAPGLSDGRQPTSPSAGISRGRRVHNTRGRLRSTAECRTVVPQAPRRCRRVRVTGAAAEVDACGPPLGRFERWFKVTWDGAAVNSGGAGQSRAVTIETAKSA